MHDVVPETMLTKRDRLPKSHAGCRAQTGHLSSHGRRSPRAGTPFRAP